MLNAPSPRSVLRPTPAGRSLKIRSPLSSSPVRKVYGDALDVLNEMPICRFFTIWLLSVAFRRCRTSLFAGPQSRLRSPNAGTLNAPSLLLRFLASV